VATYVLIHGGGDSSFHWHLLEPELRARGHEPISMDLPCEDDAAGFAEYADAVVEAVGQRREAIIVAQSLGAFTAALVCDRMPVRLLVLIAGMVPRPGERGEDWPANTGYPGPLGATEPEIFYHDVPDQIAREARKRSRRQSDAPGEEPWPRDSWPDVPTRYLLCRQDRLFPADWMREVVQTRLGIAPDEIDSGHCPALSRPAELAERLDSYHRELDLR
jgi:pimeloyl-ACP methyl ester carboxylesterase